MMSLMEHIPHSGMCKKQYFKEGSGMDKVMSMSEAISKFVEDGDTLSLGGFTTNRKPYAAVYEILRQGQKDFVAWPGPAGGDWDMLIGEKRVKAYINCYTANSGFTNVARRFRAAIEKGELVYEDYSQDVIMLQLHAAALGLPFLPTRLMHASGLTDHWGISEETRATLDKVDNKKFVYMDNPFNPGEKCVAVPVPKLDTAIIHVQMASPDGTCIIEGDEFHDVDIAVAARKVIITCEELVSNEYIRQDPTKVRIFCGCVDAVVHVPFGAWPSQCYGYYDDDPDCLREYDKASKYADVEDAKAQMDKKQIPYDPEHMPETFVDFLDKWVYSVKDHNELLDKIGATRLIRLKNMPGLGYSVNVK